MDRRPRGHVPFLREILQRQQRQLDQARQRTGLLLPGDDSLLGFDAKRDPQRVLGEAVTPAPFRVGGAGAIVVAFFAFGALMTALDFVWLIGGEQKQGTILFVILLAAAVGASRDFHTVRTCDDSGEPCHNVQREFAAARRSASLPAEPRRTVASAASAWRSQAAQNGASATEPVPMIVVATAGGGLRAAYWTAVMLERIEARLGGDTFRKHLFAISGVSGGSVGAAFYVFVAGNRPTQSGSEPQSGLSATSWIRPSLRWLSPMSPRCYCPTSVASIGATRLSGL
jgi:hypothetical protein